MIAPVEILVLASLFSGCGFAGCAVVVRAGLRRDPPRPPIARVDFDLGSPVPPHYAHGRLIDEISLLEVQARLDMLEAALAGLSVAAKSHGAGTDSPIVAPPVSDDVPPRPAVPVASHPDKTVELTGLDVHDLLARHGIELDYGSMADEFADRRDGR